MDVNSHLSAFFKPLLCGVGHRQWFLGSNSRQVHLTIRCLVHSFFIHAIKRKLNLPPKVIPKLINKILNYLHHLISLNLYYSPCKKSEKPRHKTSGAFSRCHSFICSFFLHLFGQFSTKYLLSPSYVSSAIQALVL